MRCFSGLIFLIWSLDYSIGYGNCHEDLRKRLEEAKAAGFRAAAAFYQRGGGRRIGNYGADKEIQAEKYAPVGETSYPPILDVYAAAQKLSADERRQNRIVQGAFEEGYHEGMRDSVRRSRPDNWNQPPPPKPDLGRQRFP